MKQKTQTILKKLYDENIDALYRFAYFKMQSQEEDVLDILQEVFYKFALELEKGKEIENPKAYLYRSVSHKIIDYHRKTAPVSLEQHIENFSDTFEDSTNIEDITHAKLEVEKIYRILAGLDAFDKDIFILRYVEEVSPKDIAQMYQSDVNAITVRLHRIKSKIQKHFEYS